MTINSMPLDRKILYSLFGAPLRQDIGTTIDGHRAYDQINPANPTLIFTLMFSVFLFAVYMWFYLSPLFRERPPYRSSTAEPRPAIVRPRHNIRIVDPELNMSSLQDEKKSLISWIHRSSLGRFIDVTGRIHNKAVDRDSDDHPKLKVNLKHGPTKFGIRPLGVEDYQIFNLRGARPPPSLPLHFGNDLLLDVSRLQAQLHDGSPVPILAPPPPVYTPHPSPPSTGSFVQSPGAHSDATIDPYPTLKQMKGKSATDRITVSTVTCIISPPSPPSPSRQ
ncbi:hypothetical protein AX14_010723 [Amanita brunnescens Koide BX004]|nr:hypothetical protein AX14_010723 [Amanita brunnescens Koide BX004]